MAEKSRTVHVVEIQAETRELQKSLAALKQDFSGMTMPQNMINAFAQLEQTINTILTKTKNGIIPREDFSDLGRDLKTVRRGFNELTGAIDDVKNASDKKKLSLLPPDTAKKLNKLQETYNAYANTLARVQTKEKEYANAQKRVTDAKEKQRAAEEAYTAAKKTGNLTAEQDRAYNKAVADASAKVTEAYTKQTVAYQELQRARTQANAGANGEKTALTSLQSALKAVGVDYNSLKLDNKSFEEQLTILQGTIGELNQKELKKFNQSLKKTDGSLAATTQQVEKTNDAFANTKTTVEETDDSFKRQEAFEGRIKQFLGLAGAAQVLRRALRDAMQTITELDKTMTEMAVVTDLTVGDYWKQLPEYSKRATELGVSINSAYKAATLYYQQGLKTNEVNQVSTETLKMARIAGLSAEEATNKMTAALRGFNMELNQTSAQNVADVYSKLAAITASDVEEISTAMTKTASIANSAGMEFETTAAFLSQIIETTRESAETAGTALKTVIARFQELKKSPDQIGEIDGEIVDANKIETALRSVGVALRDSAGQFRNLDDVFLELASKWDTLDKNTQRYIATIAAGSRQQSRFLAMMSNYSRTQELVTAANNAAGASQEQFNKTLESLDAKLEQLKNAWHEFTMGIMNSDLVKFGIDMATKFLEIINKATAGFNSWSGALTKIISVIGIFKMGSLIFKKFEPTLAKFFGDIIKQAGETGEKAGDAMAQGVKKSTLKAAREENRLENKKYKLTKEGKKQGYKLDKTGMLHRKNGQIASKEEFEQLTQMKKGWDEIGKTMQAVGAAAVGIGLALSFVSNVFEDMGLDAASEIIGNIAKGVTMVGTALMVIPPLITAIGTAINVLTNTNPILLAITAIIVALIAAFAVFAVIYKKNSPAEKLKEATKAAQEAETAAKDAADAYDKLGDSLQDLGDKYKVLDELRKGTEEWNQAVQDINGSVLELIEKYPELAQLVTNEGGVLKLDVNSDDVRKVVAEYNKNAIRARGAAISARINENSAKEELLRQKYNQGKISYSEYTSQKAALGSSTGAYYTAMITNAQQSLDLSTYTQTQIDQMTTLVGEEMLKTIIATQKDAVSKMSRADLNEAKEEYVRNTYGAGYTVKGNKVYNEEGEEVRKFTDETFKNAIAAAKATEKAANKMEDLVDAIPNVGEAVNKGFAGKDLTQAELTDFSKAKIDDPDLKAAQERLVAIQNERWSKALDLSSILGTTIADNMSSGAALAWMQGLQRVAPAGGDVSALNKQLTGLLGDINLKPDDVETIMSVINSLDMTDVNAWEGLSASLMELGVNINKTDWDNFTQNAIKASNAIRKVDYNQLASDISKVYELLGMTKEGNRKFTEEQYKSLTSRDKSLEKAFIQVGDQFIYVNGTIEQLNEAITKNTDAQLQDATALLARQKDMATIFNEVAKGQGSDVANMSLQEQANYIQAMRIAAARSGYNVSDWGIAGLTNEVDLQKLTADQIKDAALQLAQIAANPELYTENYTRSLQSAQVVRMKENTASFNASLAAQGNEAAKQALLLQAQVAGTVSNQLYEKYYNATTEEELLEVGQQIAKLVEAQVEESTGREAYKSLIDRVTDALEQVQQKEIDKLSDINDSINDANTQLLNKIQEQIDDQRERENLAKSRQGIADMYSQMAYLGMDTSGMNALTVKELGEKIEDAEKDLQDTLVDQALQQLSDANEEASKQRERQITIMEQQLEYAKESGDFTKKAEELVNKEASKGFNIDTSEIAKLLYGTEFVEAMGEEGKKDWRSGLYQGLATVQNWYDKKKNSKIDVNPKGTGSGDGIGGTGTVGKSTVYGKAYTNRGEYMKTYKKIGVGSQNGFIHEKFDKHDITKDDEEDWGTVYYNDSNGLLRTLATVVTGNKEGGETISVAGFNDYDVITDGSKVYLVFDGKGYETNKEDEMINKARENGVYATGGLVSSTGPAWLDGTKSAPEYVLSAAQTEKFFSLIDVLDRNTSSGTSTGFGDNYFDINIQVDQLANDYDVEKVANKIRRMIYDDAMYRNVNAVHNIR